MRRLAAILALLLPVGALAQHPTYDWITLTPRVSDPSPIADGNCWTTTAGLFCRINGATVGPFQAGATTLAAGPSGTVITGGTAGRVLYDNSGHLDEYSAASLTAQILAFSATASGAVPASGGGSTNVLHADGSWAPAGGGGSLSGLTAATGANTIANGDNAQVWNWTLTTAAKSAFTIGEAAAATNGAGSQYLLDVDTLASSTAGPLRISVQGTPALTIGNTGALAYTPPPNPATNGNGLAISLTGGLPNGSGTGGTVSLTGGAGTSSSGSTGGPLQLQAGGASNLNTGGTALLAGGDNASAGGSGGATTVRGGDSFSGTGGNLNLRSGSPLLNGSSGNINITTSSALGNNAAGNIVITAGDDNGANPGAPITIKAGSNAASGGLAWNQNGGKVSITAGNGGFQDSNGGDVVITPGAKSGAGRNGVVQIVSLPTADPGVAGALWIPSTGAVAVSGTAQGVGVSCAAGTVSLATLVVTNGIVTHC